MFGYFKAIVNDLKDDDEKLPTLKSSEESKIESKEVNEIINQPIKQFEIDETNVKEISKDDDYDKVLDREKDLLQKLSKFQNLYYEEQKENVKLKSRLLNVEKEIENKLLEQRLQLEENTNKLHQEKIILSARLEEMELHHSSSNKFSNEEISSMKQCIHQQEKELKEQERLLQGYQQENERLYLELKTVQKQKKLNEGKHKTQIEKLHSELIRVKEQLYLRERASNFKLKEVEKSENTSNIEKNNDENAKGEIIQINEDESLKQTLSMKQEEISVNINYILK
ncbi:centrosomal protein of 162 kDa-like [Centruroides sculpturatus]|uniref:centrosomal protein of 162 kDa-like n=1 Tax=Centruroides sculpturatus TaxID=218467 RepID=UPI000C6DA2B3|nr:centrosomal protein of 162 kDa-like [Centruroides sculpturatus]